MWTCPKCQTSNVGGACSGCVRIVDKVTDSRHLGASTPEHKHRPRYFTEKPHIHHTTSEEKHAFYERKRAMAEGRIKTDLLLNDPSFDASVAGSRIRLERALAVASEIALRRAENGMALETDADFIAKIASMYRTIANTVISKDPSEMTEEELAAQVRK